MLELPIIDKDDERYLIKQLIRDSETINVEYFKELYNCDVVFRKDGVLYFCVLIQKAIFEDIIEETALVLYDNNNKK